MKREETSYKDLSSDERESKKSLGFWIPHRGFWIQGTGFRILCHWNVDSGFQSVVGFRILELNSEFQFSKSRIPDCASKNSWIPNSSSKTIHELRNPEFFSWSEIVRKIHRLKSFRLKEFVVVLKALKRSNVEPTYNEGPRD